MMKEDTDKRTEEKKKKHKKPRYGLLMPITNQIHNLNAT